MKEKLTLPQKSLHRLYLLALLVTAGALLLILLPHQAGLLLGVGFVATSGRLIIRGARQPSHADDARRPSERRMVGVLGAAAVLSMVASAYFFRPEAVFTYTTAALLMLLGGGFLLAALRLARAPAGGIPVPPHERLTLTPFSIRDGLALLAGAALLLFTTANSSSYPAWLPQRSHHLQFAALGGGILLVALGLSGARLTAAFHGLRRRWNAEAVGVLLLMLLSFALLTWRLDDAVHILIDEFHGIDAVIDLWTRGDIQILTPYNTMASFPWVYPYLQSAGIAVFGTTLTGVRMVSAIFGALTVPALYGLAKRLFDRPTAALAALLLATFPPHIHMSRLGLINAADPFFGTLLLWLLARALQTGHREHYALAGVCLGVTQYFYEGGKLLFPALVVLWLLAIGLSQPRRLSARALGWMLAAAIITAAPLYLSWASWGLPLFPRMNALRGDELDWGAVLTLSDGGAALRAYLERHLLPPLLHFVHLPDASGFYYGGHTPLILGYFVPAFLLGIFHALWRRPAGALPLLWVALAVLGNSLLQPDMTAWTARFQVIFPAVALLLALGIRDTLRLFGAATNEPSGQWSESRWLRVGLALVVAALAALGPLYYFRDHLPAYNLQVRPYLDHLDAFERARLLPPGTPVIFVTDDPVHTDHFATLSAFWDFDPLVTMIPSTDLTADYVAALPESGAALFIDPQNAIAPALLRATVGDVDGPHFSPYNVPESRQYALYYLPPRQP